MVNSRDAFVRPTYSVLDFMYLLPRSSVAELNEVFNRLRPEMEFGVLPQDWARFSKEQKIQTLGLGMLEDQAVRLERYPHYLRHRDIITRWPEFIRLLREYGIEHTFPDRL